MIINEDIYDTSEYVKCAECQEYVNPYDDWVHVAKNGLGESVYLCECCIEDMMEKGRI